MTTKLQPGEVIAVVGPTAIGKTAVAIEVAHRLNGRAEILSADSVQVYRGLDIGSAKPTVSERATARFHLIDIADPDQDFSLSDYQCAARAAYEDAVARGNTPILAGGTGLYVRALTQPLGLPHVSPDPGLRERWRLFAAVQGQGALHRELARLDPETSSRLHANDTKRIIRALEVLERTGKRLSDWHREDRESGAALFPNVRLFGLNRERSSLQSVIDRRVDEMMEAGFAAEVARLREEGYAGTLNSMQSLGYKELNACLDGAMSLTEAVDQIKLRTRQFARRQLIWFRADPRIGWIDVEGVEVRDVADRILSLISD